MKSNKVKLTTFLNENCYKTEAETEISDILTDYDVTTAVKAHELKTIQMMYYVCSDYCFKSSQDLEGAINYYMCNLALKVNM